MHSLHKLLERSMHLSRGELCLVVELTHRVVLLQTPFNLLWKISQCLSNKEGYRKTNPRYGRFWNLILHLQPSRIRLSGQVGARLFMKEDCANTCNNSRMPELSTSILLYQ